MAAPPRPEPVRAQARLNLRLSVADLDTIKALADAAGLSVSAFVRSVALGREIRAKRAGHDHAVVRELAKLGNNLNQLARAANSGAPLNPIEIKTVLRELEEAIRRL